MCRNRAVSLLVGLAAATSSTPTSAYVPTLDEQTGKPVRWREREIVLTPSAPGGVGGELLAAELERAAAAWTTDAGCTQLRFRIEPPSNRVSAARRDGINAVVVRDDVWCRSGEPSRFHCYDPDEQAMTTTYLGRDEKTGDVWIEEADIEINAVHYRWSGKGSGASGGLELSDLFLHELGHVVGLAHDCDDGFLHPSSIDHVGRRPLDCTSPRARRPAAMAPDPPPLGATLSLAADEKLAVCEIYRPAPPQKGSFSASNCGCHTIGRPVGHGADAALALLLALAMLFRRRAFVGDGGEPRSTLWVLWTRGGLA